LSEALGSHSEVNRIRVQASKNFRAATSPQARQIITQAALKESLYA